MKSLPQTTSAEITRTDLTTPILQLKSLGIDDLMKFEWVSSPPAETVLRALENLATAGMVGEDGRLTVTGEKVSEFPIEVNVARMVRFSLRLVLACANRTFSCLLRRITIVEKICLRSQR